MKFWSSTYQFRQATSLILQLQGTSCWLWSVTLTRLQMNHINIKFNKNCNYMKQTIVFKTYSSSGISVENKVTVLLDKRIAFMPRLHKNWPHSLHDKFTTHFRRKLFKTLFLGIFDSKKLWLTKFVVVKECSLEIRY